MAASNKISPQPILLVEDSEDDYEATMRAFHKSNMRNPVKWCRSGQIALDYLHSEGKKNTGELPGVILLDLNMPGLDGRKTLGFIKADAVLRRIPVIVLTTSSDERDVNDCYQMGANTYIQKPVSFDGLIDAIKQLKEYWFEIALLPKDG
ncbi:MAG: response regulator [Alphaproteobacteria bacterium]|nr:response regulator [Alphaproteobacteria bacterium]